MLYVTVLYIVYVHAGTDVHGRSKLYIQWRQAADYT
jgi:hypothetical protein